MMPTFSFPKINQECPNKSSKVYASHYHVVCNYIDRQICFLSLFHWLPIIYHLMGLSYVKPTYGLGWHQQRVCYLLLLRHAYKYLKYVVIVTTIRVLRYQNISTVANTCDECICYVMGKLKYLIESL